MYHSYRKTHILLKLIKCIKLDEMTIIKFFSLFISEKYQDLFLYRIVSRTNNLDNIRLFNF